MTLKLWKLHVLRGLEHPLWPRLLLIYKCCLPSVAKTLLWCCGAQCTLIHSSELLVIDIGNNWDLTYTLGQWLYIGMHVVLKETRWLTQKSGMTSTQANMMYSNISKWRQSDNYFHNRVHHTLPCLIWWVISNWKPTSSAASPEWLGRYHLKSIFCDLLITIFCYYHWRLLSRMYSSRSLFALA